MLLPSYHIPAKWQSFLQAKRKSGSHVFFLFQKGGSFPTLRFIITGIFKNAYFQNLAFLLLLILKPPGLKAQQEVIPFGHIGLEQGLPQGQIIGLLQDSHGYLWFGTMTGVIRYDGCNFARYAHLAGDSTSLSHSTAMPFIEDRNGFIWIGSHTGLNRWDRKSNKFQRFYHDPNDPNSLPGNDLTTVFEDKNGTIWAGTDRGLAWFDGKKFHRAALSKNDGEEWGFHIYSIGEDADGRLLAATRFGLVEMEGDKKRGAIRPVGATGGPVPEVWKVYKDRRGNIWAGTDTGLFFQKKEGKTFARIPLKGTPGQQAVRNIIEDPQGRLWLATLNDNGLFRLTPSTGEVEHFKHSPGNAFGLGSNHVREFMIDRLNQLWIGTYNGLNKVDLNPPRFAFLQQEPGDLRPENQVYKAWTDRQGGLWFSNYEQRAFYAKTPGQKAVEFDFLPDRPKPLLLENFHHASDGGRWFATSPNGILRRQQGRDIWLDSLTVAGDSLELLGWFFMEEDLDDPDLMWFSSNNGLCKLHKRTLQRTFFPPKKDIPSLHTNLIVNGLEAPDGHIYVLFESHFNGKLGRFDKRSGRYQLIETSRAFPDGKSTIHVRQFALTPDGTVWMATADGLGKYEPGSDTFTLLTTEEGMVENNLMGIATDVQGNVWVKSMQHLTKYHLASGSFWHFNVAKDMKEFNAVGAATGPAGRMFFYGNNGFYAFSPDSVRLDSTLPRPVLTDFKVLNESRLFGTSPELIRSITLGYRDNVLSFEFAALHFRDPARNRYRYQMEGFDKNWVEAGTERKVTYTSLDAGRYTFRVMACNADGVWNPEPLAIELRLLPPPWATWWAYCLYLLAAAAAAYAFYFYKKRRWQIQSQLEMEHREAGRLKELDAVKTKLYTNITHEFRTPLTIILGMVKQIKTNPKDWYSEGLQMIERSGQNLLRLVNQMLDLSKLEAGAMPVHLVQGDVIAFLKYLLESFHSLAAEKGIALHFYSDREALVMDYDPDKVQKIVSNLLSNAVKFTPEGGQVVARLSRTGSGTPGSGEPGYLCLSVSDTGPGIPPEKLPRIFDRFYQAEESAVSSLRANRTGGTGIGLALTKELVKLLGGEISVKSEIGQGTEFEVRLPVKQSPPPPPPDPLKGEPQMPHPAENFEKTTPELPGLGSPPLAGSGVGQGGRASNHLLLVEDNPDVVRYLQSFLSEKYQIEVAVNGRVGIEKAIETVPDIIISDVMMPEADGYELCGTLKKDERTSHIPIILLTAKADAASRLEGLGCGADAYLAKPFDREELLVRLWKMVELRKTLQQRYTGRWFPEPSGDHRFRAEDGFMKKLAGVLEDRYADETFDIPELCQALCMSRAQCYRKITALTGKPAAHLLRSFRLQKAKSLLASSGLSISQIALEVGFKDPAHFSRSFHQEFGVSPREMGKR